MKERIYIEPPAMGREDESQEKSVFDVRKREGNLKLVKRSELETKAAQQAKIKAEAAEKAKQKESEKQFATVLKDEFANKREEKKTAKAKAREDFEGLFRTGTQG